MRTNLWLFIFINQCIPLLIKPKNRKKKKERERKKGKKEQREGGRKKYYQECGDWRLRGKMTRVHHTPPYTPA